MAELWHVGFGADFRMPVMGRAHADQQEKGVLSFANSPCSPAVSGVALHSACGAGRPCSSRRLTARAQGTGVLVLRWPPQTCALCEALAAGALRFIAASPLGLLPAQNTNICGQAACADTGAAARFAPVRSRGARH